MSVARLIFCQNDYPIRGSFWQRDCSITHILFELCFFECLAHLQIFVYQSLLTLNEPIRKFLAQSDNQLCSLQFAVLSRYLLTGDLLI